MKQPVRSPAELLAPGRPLTFANVAEGAEGLVISDLARAVAAKARPGPPENTSENVDAILYGRPGDPGDVR